MLCGRMLRVLDMLLSSAGLIFAAPIIILAALLIKRDSPGPPIFAQVRIGRNHRTFTCYKLRTMAAGTRQGASHEVGTATITRIGVVLRRTKLDELPKLSPECPARRYEPRRTPPCLPSQIELIRARERHHVFTMRPGITGLAQIAGLDMSQPELLAANDANWLDHHSALAYARILLATVMGGGAGDGRVSDRRSGWLRVPGAWGVLSVAVQT